MLMIIEMAMDGSMNENSFLQVFTQNNASSRLLYLVNRHCSKNIV